MIYVTGANGQLGSELKLILGEQAQFLSRTDLDLSNLNQVTSFLKNSKIDLLINAGAYTQVDKAETEKELALNINAKAPTLMSEFSRTRNFKLIHFSTDYVFNGRSSTPLSEGQATDPVNFYGQTKLEGEVGVIRENSKNLIIRTSWVYSQFGRNFVKTMMKLGSERDELRVVFDQVGTLTSAQDLAQVALKARELSGIYHYSNEGVSSWFDVAYEIKRLTKFKASVLPIESFEFPTPAKRPNYSVLNKNKIKTDLGIRIPHWMESLETCLRKLS